MVSMCKFVLGYILVLSSYVFSQKLDESSEFIRLTRSPRFHKHHGSIFGILGGGGGYHETPYLKPNGGFGGGAAQSQASAGGAQAQAQSQSLFFGFGPFAAGLAQSQAQAQAGGRRRGFDYYDY